MPLFLEMLRRETEAAPKRRAAALRGVRRYQEAVRSPPCPKAPIIDRMGSTLLRDFGGPADAMPLVFVPSLINPPDILDLHEGRSLLRWLAAQGHRVLMLDWSTPDEESRRLDVTGHVERRLLPLLERLGRPAVLAGYCLGGTMALGAADAAGAAGVAVIAAPWRFAGYGDQARVAAARLWAQARPSCEASGLVPMELLQFLFWQLDPARTVAKFGRFGALDPESAAARDFLRLEDWANAGAPLPLAAAAQLFDWIADDDAPGRGEWLVAGTLVRPDALDRHSIAFVSRNDRIVPAATAAPIPDRRLVDAGHVGMMIGRQSFETLWQPLQTWVARTVQSGQ